MDVDGIWVGLVGPAGDPENWIGGSTDAGEICGGAGELIAEGLGGGLQDVGGVIAVDVNAEGAKFFGSTSSVIGVLLQSMLVVQKTASRHQLSLADHVIKPKVGHIRWDEMGRAEELMIAGYEAGLESVSEIRALIEAAAATNTDFSKNSPALTV